MKSGAELDAIIMEKVMKWEKASHPGNFWADPSHFCLRVATDDVWAEGRWSPSTEIADAWEVVEKLRDFKHPEDPSASFTVWQHFEGGYCAGWTWHESEHGIEHGDTAPLAICLAALNAVIGPHRK